MKKRITALIYFLIIQQTTFAQIVLPSYPGSIFSTYYLQRVSHFETLPQTEDDIIFAGNSITDGAEWGELFHDVHVKNRGINGDITSSVIHRLDEIANRKPAKVFLLIGVNDLARPVSIPKQPFFRFNLPTYCRRRSGIRIRTWRFRKYYESIRGAQEKEMCVRLFERFLQFCRFFGGLTTLLSDKQRIRNNKKPERLRHFAPFR